MSDADIKNRVIAIVTSQTGVPPSKISLSTRLYHDLGIAGDDASEFLQEYTMAFSLDMTNFDFGAYFPSEASILDLFRVFRCREDYSAITVEDLVRAAQRGKWSHADR